VSEPPAPHARAMLVARTPESRAAQGGFEREIPRLPYRVGRESRGIQRTPRGFVSERRDPGPDPTTTSTSSRATSR